MKESKTQGERQKIFSCCFNDEQTVRSQGGVPTNVTFSNGVAICPNTASLLFNKFIAKGVYSIRIKFSSITQQTGVGEYYFHAVTTGGIYNNNATDTMSSSSGTVYQNGVVSNTMIYGRSVDVIITGISLENKGLFYINKASTGFAAIASYELFEIYQGTLTAQEVANLYNNSRLRDVNFNKTEQLGPELIVDGGFDTPSAWSIGSRWTISGGKATFDDTGTGNFTSAVAVPLTVGKRYRVTYTISGCSGTAQIGILTAAGVQLFEYGTYLPRVNGSYSNVYLCTGANTGFRVYSNNTSDSTFSLDDLSIKEILTESTQEILNVCACADGVVRNKYSGDVYGVNLLGNSGYGSATDWVDSNSDGLADGLNPYGAGQTFSIVTGNGFTGNAQRCDGTGYSGWAVASILVTGKRYRLRFKYRSSGIIRILDNTPTVFISLASTSGILSFYELEFVANGANLCFTFNASSGYFEIDEVCIREVIPSVVNTAITIRKENEVYSPEFNGSTSKIDCGSYDTLVGDKTFVAWVNFDSIGGGASSDWARIIDNGKLIIRHNGTSGFQFSSDGLVSAATILEVSKKEKSLLVWTRTSSGIITRYKNGVLYGTANEVKGAPVAGTTNIIIGNQNAGSRSFDGLIPSVRIFNGILSPDEISQMYTNEKSKYGL